MVRNLNPFRYCWEGWTWKNEVNHQLRRFGFVFAWYDLWVGFYYDRRGSRLYIFSVPMLGFYIDLRFIKHYKGEGLSKKERKYMDNKECPVCRTKSGVIQARNNDWQPQGSQPYKEYKCSSCGKVWTARKGDMEFND